MNIEFIENVSVGVINFDLVKQWVAESIVKEGRKVGNLTFVFMTDDALLEYNIKYLEHDFYTDVITFDDSKYFVIGGDILISNDRIVDNSNILNKNYIEEFLRVIIHGVLHLCGYMDKEKKDINIMREKEDFYLSRIKYDNIVSRETLL
jgi:rRNA maturation RNase YbeY